MKEMFYLTTHSTHFIFGYMASDCSFLDAYAYILNVNQLSKCCDLFQVPANHLLSASVMSAPAALAMSKLFCPATEKTQVDENAVYKMQRG